MDSDFSLRNYPYGGEKKKYITANRSMCSRRCHKLITKKDSAIQARKLAKRHQFKHDEICVSIKVAVMREESRYEGGSAGFEEERNGSFVSGLFRTTRKNLNAPVLAEIER